MSDQKAPPEGNDLPKTPLDSVQPTALENLKNALLSPFESAKKLVQLLTGKIEALATITPKNKREEEQIAATRKSAEARLELAGQIA